MEVLQGEVCDRSGIRIQIVTHDCQRSPILNNHVGRTHCAESIDCQTTCRALNTENLALTVLWGRECRAVGAVVVEEAV